MLPLNEKQKEIVEKNKGLVGTVIKDNVRNVNNLGIFTYDDIFQIGCEGLIKAAKKYAPGETKFSTFAYIFIRNEIFNALDYATVRRRGENIEEIDTVLRLMPVRDELDEVTSDLNKFLFAAKARATGVVSKGIDAIIMMADGYTCREIGELMGGIPANNITAWVSKARAFLKNDPDILAVRDSL
jgi:RNA polymerase sigma factor (sigma-70 family)